MRENEREWVLRTAAGQDVTIAKDQIVKKKPGGSLMPSGLTDTLSHEEQLDLFRFLSELGKAGPFDASSASVARAWKIAAAPPEADPAALTGDHWHPLASLVDGRLLRQDIENRVGAGAENEPSILAGATFRSVKSGPAHFNLTAPADAEIWMDGKTVAPGRPLAVDLAAGAHTVVIKLDARQMPEYIRLQSEDAAFLAN